MTDPNKLSFDLKAMMSDPAKMAQFQNMVQSRLAGGDLTSLLSQGAGAGAGAAPANETPEERKERLRRELRAKIRQKEMQRQGKSVQVAQQMKEMKKAGVENVDEMVQHIARGAAGAHGGVSMDARQQKMLKREMEKLVGDSRQPSAKAPGGGLGAHRPEADLSPRGSQEG